MAKLLKRRSWRPGGGRGGAGGFHRSQKPKPGQDAAAHRCAALTNAGKQCSRKPMVGSLFCRQHA